MYWYFRPLIFKLEPEKAHSFCLKSLNRFYKNGLARKMLQLKTVESEPVKVMGLEFPNRVGLAAGLDKDGDYIDALASLGFGHIELGTVTPLPQVGNPQPRLFRLPSVTAIINRMGFNNKGVDYLVNNVKKSQFDGIIGINIGKNKDTPIENAVDDYGICMEKVYEVASYITINISSPNTPGLRELQFGEYLDNMLANLKTMQFELTDRHGKYVPLAVKVAPDLSDDELRSMATVLMDNDIDAIIATNTTVKRDTVNNTPHARERGGLSGAPLMSQATRCVEIIKEVVQDKIPIIGVGGITHGDHAVDKLNAGADLVQIYTGFIYNGPEMISDCLLAINKAKGPKEEEYFG